MSTSNIPTRDNWNFNYINKDILKDKERLIRSYIKYMLIRTQRMFEYENLPATIPAKDLELIEQICGYAVITEKDGKLYAFYGGLGGELNEYYKPTLSVVANPYLKFFKVLDIGENCEVVLNDALYMGLTPMFDKYSTMLAECDISLRYACINSRIPMLGVANDDETAKSFENLFDLVEKGESMKAVVTDDVITDDAFKTKDYFSKNTGIIKELIELKQYTLGSWYNDLGIHFNVNMKREYVSESETSSNLLGLLPLIDEMLIERQLGWERVNKHYGTNVKVRLSSSWEELRKDILLDTERQESEIAKNLTQGSEDYEIERNDNL